MREIKQILCGIAIILFGMLFASMDNIWLPILGSLSSDAIGALIGAVGVVFAVRGYSKNNEKEGSAD